MFLLFISRDSKDNYLFFLISENFSITGAHLAKFILKCHACHHTGMTVNWIDLMILDKMSPVCENGRVLDLWLDTSSRPKLPKNGF